MESGEVETRPVEDLGRAGFTDGARYHAARPDYPNDAIDFLVASLGLGDVSRVLDLGAGTGIMTRQLTDRFADVIAVEPSPGMRSAFMNHLGQVPVLDGCDTDIPLQDDSVDCVFVAQAFHWFDYPRALREIHRVLVPGGGLALIWNERDESVDWVAELGEAMGWTERRPYAVGVDFTSIVAAGPFVGVERRQFQHAQVLDRAGLYRRVETTSYIAVMGDDERRRVMDGIRAVVERLSEPITLPYVTEAYRATATLDD